MYKSFIHISGVFLNLEGIFKLLNSINELNQFWTKNNCFINDMEEKEEKVGKIALYLMIILKTGSQNPRNHMISNFETQK